MAGKGCAQCGKKRASWTTQSLASAMAAVIDKRLGLRAAAREYSIPPTTLKDHLDRKNKYATGDTKHLGRPPILSPELEKELADYILKCESICFGLTRKDIMSVAYEIATRNGIQHVFNGDKKTAGKRWLKLFLQRHPQISHFVDGKPTMENPDPVSEDPSSRPQRKRKAPTHRPLDISLTAGKMKKRKNASGSKNDSETAPYEQDTESTVDSTPLADTKCETECPSAEKGINSSYEVLTELQDLQTPPSCKAEPCVADSPEPTVPEMDVDAIKKEHDHLSVSMQTDDALLRGISLQAGINWSPILEFHTTNVTMTGVRTYKGTMVHSDFISARAAFSCNVLGHWTTAGHGVNQFTQLIQYDSLDHLVQVQRSMEDSVRWEELCQPLEKLVVSSDSILTVLAPQSQLFHRFPSSKNAVYELQILPERDCPIVLGSEATLVGSFLPLYSPSNKEYRLVRYPTTDSAFTAALHSINALPAGSERRLLLPLSSSMMC